MKKNLIVVGVNGNLGMGVTKHLLKDGYDKYYLIDRKVVEFVKDIENIKVITVSDLSNEDSVVHMFDQINLNLDDEYFLFSTVGGFDSSPIIDMDYSKWKAMFALNSNISFLLAKHFSKLVSKSAGGSICFTSAITAKEPSKNKSAYGASKAALEYMVKTLAIESKEYGLSCNAIAPYILDTTENREWVDEKSLLTNPLEVGYVVNQIFDRYKLISGNVIELRGKVF